MTTNIRNKYNRTRVGFYSGLFTPLVLFLLIYLRKYPEMTFVDYIRNLWFIDLIAKIVSLCVFPNILIFLFFIRKKYDWAARGVLMATLLYALFVLAAQLF